jgi:HAD superfamily hydrolase (TIGR01509 family)
LAVKHIIFDCDGVLVDSEPLSMRADVMLLREHGVVISEAEAHARFVGKTFQAMLEEMSEAQACVFPVGLSAQKDRMLEELFVRELTIVEGATAVLDHLSARGIGCSVASNSPRARVLLALKVTGIAGRFTDVTTFEEVKLGKPAPDVFLRAVEKSGFAAASCVAIEDSVTGVTAAVAAGLRTIGFCGTHPHRQEHRQALAVAGAVLVIDSLESILGID